METKESIMHELSISKHTSSPLPKGCLIEVPERERVVETSINRYLTAKLNVSSEVKI